MGMPVSLWMREVGSEFGGGVAILLAFFYDEGIVMMNEDGVCIN